MMKKNWLLLTSAALCVSFLAGCGQISDKPRQVEDLPLEITVGQYTEQNEPEYFEVSGTYTGPAVHGLPEGEGTFSAENKAGITYVYNGAFSEGTFDGYGSMVWDDEEYPYRQDGTYTKGLYTPTKSEWINSLGQTSMASGFFSLSDASQTFIDEHDALFPTGSESEAAGFVNADAEMRKLKKSLDDFDHSLMRLENVRLNQTFEADYAGKPVTSLLIMDENFDMACIYYPGKIDYYEGDTIPVIYALPLANTSFDNISGGTTLCLSAFGSYID